MGRQMKRLASKTCLITGAAKGIGAAIAKAFAEEGAYVVVTDVDNVAGEKLAKNIGGTFVKLDVSFEDSWVAFEKIHPEMDVVVNNAGITGLNDHTVRHDPEHVSYEEWRRVHAINLDGTMFGCRYAIRAMKEKGKGSIINLSSRSGMVGIPGAAAYASSKAAIRNHTKSVALYCAQQGWGIRCNSIHPAAVMTPMWDSMLSQGEAREAQLIRLAQDIPMKRFGKPEEVAALAILLASDEVPFMTGAELTLDGGILAGSASAPGDDGEQ